MAALNELLILVSILLVMCIQTGESISCFQCNSKNDTQCEDLKPEDTWSRHYLPCDPHPLGHKTFCRKIVQSIKLPGLEHVRVIRKCGWSEGNRPCYRNEDEDHEEFVCQCFEDGCNSAESRKPVCFIAATLLSYLVSAWL